MSPKHFDEKNTKKNITSWWFQPIWKILVKMGSSPPRIGMKIKNLWNHHLDQIRWKWLGISWQPTSSPLLRSTASSRSALNCTQSSRLAVGRAKKDLILCRAFALCDLCLLCQLGEDGMAVKHRSETWNFVHWGTGYSKPCWLSSSPPSRTHVEPLNQSVTNKVHVQMDHSAIGCILLLCHLLWLLLIHADHLIDLHEDSSSDSSSGRCNSTGACGCCGCGCCGCGGGGGGGGGGMSWFMK